jgi:hypothetical protein
LGGAAYLAGLDELAAPFLEKSVECSGRGEVGCSGGGAPASGLGARLSPLDANNLAFEEDRMLLRLVLLIGLLATSVEAAGTARAAADRKPQTYQIRAVRAFLFFEGSGRFDDRDLFGGKVRLWNTSIGEGDAGEPSNATLVHVELEGPSFTDSFRGSLSLRARAREVTLLDQRVDLATFFTKGTRLVVPFLVYGTNNAPVDLEIVLKAGEKSTVLRKTLPFEGGE